MIRSVSISVLAGLTVAAAAPIAETPVQPILPASVSVPSPAPPAVDLVSGGLLQNVLVMVFPPQPPEPILPTLDRVALAVEGAESSYGRNPLMWRPDPHGPQGPMQVSEAAATDVGGGNRFDLSENRVLGRAYLARMYTRYGNWREALMAYNWGPGNLDQWIGGGRRADALDRGVSSYALRVLDESGSGDGPSLVATPPPGPPPREMVREDTIRDPHLRQKVALNNREIVRLQIFLEVSGAPATYGDKTAEWLKSEKIDPDQLAAGDAVSIKRMQDDGTKLVFGIAREVSRRPGYGSFEMTGGPKAAPDIESMRVIANVLLNKLEDENDTLAMIDAHRREERAAEKPLHVHG